MISSERSMAHEEAVPDLRKSLLAFLAQACLAREQVRLAIGGPGAAGKSTFAADLKRAVEEAGGRACLLDIDCYLRDRQERAAQLPPVSGYDPAAYRLEDAARDLAALADGIAVEVREYDKIAGTRLKPIMLHPAPILILEGSMALQPSLCNAADLRIYLTADEQVLFANRRAREITFGFDDVYILEKYRKLLPDYEAHIRPGAMRANLRLWVDDRYQLIAADYDETEPLLVKLRESLIQSPRLIEAVRHDAAKRT
jgi:uridine kinase